LERKAIETERGADIDSRAHDRLKIGAEPARRKVVLRRNGYLIHVVHNNVLTKTLALADPGRSAHQDQRPQLSIHPRTTEFPGNPGTPLHGEMRCRSPSAITVSFGGEESRH